MDAEVARSPDAARPASPGLAGPIAFLGRRPLAGLLLLIAFCLAAFLPGVTAIPPVDRDEPRYTQATKQMMETGDFVDIRFQDDPRHKKPVGIHWLQAASATLSGKAEAAPLWVYRVPSFLGAVLAVLMTVFLARAFLPAGHALATGFLMAATIILAFEARIAKTDAVLLATVVTAQAALARIWLAGRAMAPGTRLPFVGMPLLFWVAVALGLLVKGPIIAMVSGLTVLALLALDREGRGFWRSLRLVPGLLVAAAIAAPWFVAIGVVTDWAFYAGSLGRDFIGKAQTGQEGHWGPPLTHLAAFFVVAFPMSAAAVLAAPGMWARRRAPAGLFALAYVVPAWIVFELAPTKLPHYTLPLLPGIALLAVATLADPSYVPRRLLKRIAAALVAAVGLAALGAALVLPLLLADPVSVPGVALGLAGAAIALLAARTILRAEVARGLAGAVLATLVLFTAAYGFVLPGLKTVWLSPRLATAYPAAAACPEPTLVTVGFNEPSLVFLTATGTRLLGPERAVEALRTLPCAVASVDSRQEAAFLAAAGAADLAVERTATVSGFNISKGDFLDLHLYRPAP